MVVLVPNKPPILILILVTCVNPAHKEAVFELIKPISDTIEERACCRSFSAFSATTNFHTMVCTCAVPRGYQLHSDRNR